MREFTPPSLEVENIAKEIVDAAFRVHKSLGPGLMESVYEVCMTHELAGRGLSVETQLDIPIHYDDILIKAGFRLDMLVEKEVIVELKAVEEMHPVFHSQIMTYLKLMNKRLGFLINFNVPLIKDGIKRIIL